LGIAEATRDRASYNGLRQVEHPVVGRLRLDSSHLRLAAGPTLTLVLHTPVGPDDAARLRRLTPPDAPD